MKTVTETKQHISDFDRMWENQFARQFIKAPFLSRFSRVPKDEEGEIADASAM